ncbi:MAG TPA: CotH kinase family protein [Kofleriaceae bacterium]|nr:CotH kinase family protein [Kofleriaceae bacterium]
MWSVAVLVAVGCGNSAPGSGGAAVDARAGSGDGGYGSADDLATDTGCAGVFNPDQLLDYHLALSEADWAALTSDATNSVYFAADLACGDGGSIRVGVRRKRSGGTEKVGLKVDINQQVAGQSYFGLKKLSLENGVSEGDTDASARDLLSEYLAWRMMQRSQLMASRVALARVFVNGRLLGVYVNVEQVDRRFLRHRIGDDNGWLFKYSGSASDGQKTNEGIANPYGAYFCFLERTGCAAPSADQLAAELPGKLDIDQLLRMGAVNAAIANTDSPLLKFNNYLYYDWAGGPRIYLPWDLDTAMNSSYDVFTGSVPGGTTVFTDVLFTHWEDDYDAILTALLAMPLTPDAIEGETDRAVAVAGGALDADPNITGGAADAGSALATWWRARHAEVTASVEAHAP